MAGDVAGDAGVGVVAPGSADVIRAFEDDEALLTAAGQLEGCTDSGETGSDDRDVDLGHCAVGRCASGCAAGRAVGHHVATLQGVLWPVPLPGKATT